MDARHVLPAPRDARALRSRARPARLSRLPTVGVRERCARPRVRQAGLSLGAAVGSQPEPLTFVVSMRLGDPATTERLNAWLGHYPELRFKLDATTRLVRGSDRGTRSHRRRRLGRLQGPVPRHERRHRARRCALREDRCGPPPRLARGSCAHARNAGCPRARQRTVTWDAVIHSVADIEGLRWPPRTVNIKPSRFGSGLAKLFSGYDFCNEGGSARTAAANSTWRRSGSDPAARRPLPSRRHRTTSRRAGSTWIPSGGLQTSPLVVVPGATGFAFA